MKTLVPEDRRMEFLPNLVSVRFMIPFENAVYDVMRSMTGGVYKGGYWEFFEIPGGGYMAPVGGEGERVTIEVDSNGYRGEMSWDAAGIVATLFSLNDLQWRLADGVTLAPQFEFLITRYHALRDFAAEHPEAGEIFAAID
jgi:hypothetical protein